MILASQILDALEQSADPAHRRDLISLLQDVALRDADALRGHLGRIESLRARELDFEIRRGLHGIGNRLRGSSQGFRHAFGLEMLDPGRRDAIESTLAVLDSVVVAPPELSLEPEQHWDDVYEPLGLAAAAEGGFGEVFRMRRKSDGIEVALKFLKEEMADGPGTRQRFAREATILRRIRDAGGHPNLLPYIDHGDDGGDLYLVTRWARGGSLHELLRISPKGLPAAQVLPWMKQVLGGLGYMHDLRLIHRDLKPGNLYLSGGGDDDGGPIWLGDFGVVLPLDEERLTSMDIPTPITPGYAPPEQRSETEQDGRTDLYAWSVTTFKLLTGVLPRTADQSVRDLCPDVPVEWDRVLRQCHADDMDDRPESAAAVLEALADC